VIVAKAPLELDKRITTPQPVNKYFERFSHPPV
jgi:hypothetical protein